ncbi:unnamed protein product [Amoebophrya sp. A120]|nr:unnamed protein product [Amoebophrya sp. A120]|eukprot:GSA120T00021108001.1
MERRGYLLNDSTGRKEYFVLRKGVLRSYRNDQGELLKQIHLAHSGEVNLLHDGVLEIKAHAPYTWEYTLVANTEEDAEHWYDLFQSCIIESQKNIQNMIELLRNGAQLVKYNYSNYKRTRRLFWISDAGDELRWGKTKSVTEYSKVDLRDCIGIIYGPVTTTFLRCNAGSASAGGTSSSSSSRDESCSCFSLLFMGRTLDLATYGGMIDIWFLGLQYLISRYGTGGQSMPTLSDSQFLVKKAQYKIADKAHHAFALTYGRHFLQTVNDMGAKYQKSAEEFWRTKPSSTAGFRPLPRSPDRPNKLAAPKQLPGIKSADQLSRGPGAGSLPSPSPNRASSTAASAADSQRNLSQLELEVKRLENENDRLKKMDQTSGTDGNERVKFLSERCSDLEQQVIQMQDKLKQQDYNIKQFEQNEQNLKTKAEKLQTELSEFEQKDSKSKRTNEKQEEQMSKLKDEIQKKATQIETMKKKLDGYEGGENSLDKKLDTLKKQNSQLSKEIEETTVTNRQLSEENKKLKEQNQIFKSKIEKESSSKQVATVKLNQKLNDLKIQFTEFKSAVSVELRQFQDSYLVTLIRSCKQMGNQIASMQDSFKNIQAERRRLHNLVLELKGNIRVFARVRPLNDNEQDSEPRSGAKTTEFSEESKIAIYNDYDARKRWFEFDKVFRPNSIQEEVFTEAQALATSVLDGYNVCIFAYGQTGSGKTFTMRGPSDNPGLYIRVLTELFKVVGEKKMSNRISLKMMITEIYNESLRDLLVSGTNGGAGGKKVDVKLQQDGSIQLTNVEEYSIKNMNDVTRLMNDADKNRAVGTTDMNEYSSRSHQIVTIKADNESLETGSQYFGKIHLIDLAGSENVGKSGATGQTLKEAQNINKSLSALGDVISSLQNKSGHVPYRNSKLTMMLKDSLGGDAKMLMIVQCSPAQTNVTETLSTLLWRSQVLHAQLLHDLPCETTIQIDAIKLLCMANSRRAKEDGNLCQICHARRARSPLSLFPFLHHKSV